VEKNRPNAQAKLRRSQAEQVWYQGIASLMPTVALAGGNSMKMARFVVLTLVVLGCAFASAQTFGFGTSIGGTGLYCNFEQLVSNGGGLHSGIDNLSMCGSTFADISGFDAVPAIAQARVKGVVYGDEIYAIYQGFPEAQWTVFTKLKCNKVRNGRFIGSNGWVGVAAFSGILAFSNQGPLSCSIPGRNGVVPTMGASIGAIRWQDEKK
jgi:hypothetical protein